MPTALTLLFTLSACREAASTLQSIAAIWRSRWQAASSPAGQSSGGTGGLPVLSQHTRAKETIIASVRAGWSRSLGSAPARLCTASRWLAATLLLVLRRRH